MAICSSVASNSKRADVFAINRERGFQERERIPRAAGAQFVARRLDIAGNKIGMSGYDVAHDAFGVLPATDIAQRRGQRVSAPGIVGLGRHCGFESLQRFSEIVALPVKPSQAI